MMEFLAQAWQMLSGFLTQSWFVLVGILLLGILVAVHEIGRASCRERVFMMV